MICKKAETREQQILRKLEGFKCPNCGANGIDICEYFANDVPCKGLMGCGCNRYRVIRVSGLTWDDLDLVGYGD